MNKLLQAVAAKTYQLCRTYPGGIRAMFAGMRERHGLSESSVYADLNPNNGQSTLRVWELVRVMGSDRRAWAAPGACQLVRVLVGVRRR